MKRICIQLFALALTALTSAHAAGTNDAPDFKEVSDLIRANLPGVTDAELNRAAVSGLLDGLHGRVAIAPDQTQSLSATNAPVITKTLLLDDGVAYVRVARVADGLAGELKSALNSLSATNKLTGVALDLRFASGDDYAAAGAADSFLRPEKTATRLPLAVLVNSETSGAAEGLAAGLRESGAGLILGSKTAGHAFIMQEFTLKSGQHIRIATAPVRLAGGSVVAADGVNPDIAVPVKTDEERTYFADAYANLAMTTPPANSSLSNTNQLTGTNRPPRKRISEAELVRQRREGSNDDEDSPLPGVTGLDKPVLRDPVLVRAVDLLKGLALVRQTRVE